mgnify:CR=1 FL=1
MHIVADENMPALDDFERLGRVTRVDGRSLTRADLRDADLSGANLVSVRLSSANMYRTNLSGADLRRAHLADADIAGANLSGANLTGADLSGVYLNETTGIDMGPDRVFKGIPYRYRIQRSRLSNRDYGLVPVPDDEY